MLTENQQNALEVLLTEYHNDPETGVKFANEADERVVNQESVLLAIGEDVKDEVFISLVKEEPQASISKKANKLYDDEVYSQIREAVTDFID